MPVEFIAVKVLSKIKTVGSLGIAMLGARACGSSAEGASRVPTTILYHGGELIDGSVQAGRFSTTTSVEHAAQYAAQHAGQVHKFEVPTKWLYEMENIGRARQVRDLLSGTTESALEWQFTGEAASGLNAFRVTP